MKKKHRQKIFEMLDTYAFLVKFLKEHKITSYEVNPNIKKAEIKGNVIVVPPVFERIISEALKETKYV